MIYRASQMLGSRLEQLRAQQGLSLEELSRRTGIAACALGSIEAGAVEYPASEELLRITDALRLRQARDFVELVRLNPKPPRFKAYSAGLGRSGTLSMAHIFGAYRSVHQYLMSETLEMIRRHESGQLSGAAFRRFILERDAMGQLEFDASGHHYYYLDILADAFPEAKFIFVIRDCYSWFDSVVNLLHLPNSGFTSPGPFDFDAMKPICEDPQRLLRELEGLLDGPLAFWAAANATALEHLPKGRSLILRTHEISHSLEKMAEFIGIPAASLDGASSHVHRTTEKLEILRKAGPALLEAKFEQHCAPLMQQFFPGYTLDAYLRGGAGR